MLRVHERVAVDFGGGGEHEAGPLGEREVEQVLGTQRAYLEDPYRDALEVGRARGRGKMIYLVQSASNLDRKRNVLLDVLEVGFPSKMNDVLRGAGAQVVHADHAVAL